jgi:hypothetical protein
LLQDLADKRQVRIGGAGAQRVGMVEAVYFHGMANGVGVEAKGLGDGADFPMLSKELMPDVSARLFIDHGSRNLLFISTGVEETDLRNDSGSRRQHSGGEGKNVPADLSSLSAWRKDRRLGVEPHSRLAPLPLRILNPRWRSCAKT